MSKPPIPYRYRPIERRVLYLRCSVFLIQYFDKTHTGTFLFAIQINATAANTTLFAWLRIYFIVVFVGKPRKPKFNIHKLIKCIQVIVVQNLRIIHTHTLSHAFALKQTNLVSTKLCSCSIREYRLRVAC